MWRSKRVESWTNHAHLCYPVNSHTRTLRICWSQSLGGQVTRCDWCVTPVKFIRRFVESDACFTSICLHHPNVTNTCRPPPSIQLIAALLEFVSATGQMIPHVLSWNHFSIRCQGAEPLPENLSLTKKTNLRSPSIEEAAKITEFIMCGLYQTAEIQSARRCLGITTSDQTRWSVSEDQEVPRWRLIGERWRQLEFKITEKNSMTGH